MDGYGLALGGGGAKGSYEIGVWKALKELQIPIAYVTGTSVGALNGALIIQNDFDSAYKIWTEISLAGVVKIANRFGSSDTFREKFFSNLNTFAKAIAEGGLDTSPLKSLLSANINERNIRDSEIGYGIVTFSLSEMKPVKLYKEEIPDGKLIEYIIASAGLPVFKRQTIDNNSFLDGGFCDVIPVSLLLKKNVRNIISIDISAPGILNKVETAGLNIINIKNSRSTGRLLEFSREKAEENIEMGYNDTLKKFGKLKGKNYYVIPNKEFESVKDKYIKTLTSEDFKNFYKFLGLSWSNKPEPMNKLILFKIVRTLSQHAEGKLSAETILPAMIEITAAELGIQKSSVYSLENLIDRIIEKYDLIVYSTDFYKFSDEMKKLLKIRRDKFFDWELKKVISQAKFLVYFKTNFNEEDEKIKNLRRFIAVTFPKISIANMFITLILSKNN